MRALLDTHAFLWWINPHELVSAAAREVIGNPDVEIFISSVTGWEIAIKARLGHFQMPAPLTSFIKEEVMQNGFQVLSVTLDHALRVHELPTVRGHKDPFDRMLACQALTERMALISNDRAFDRYGLERIW